MNESELYKELGVLTKDKDKWEESIPYVSSLLSHDSVKIQAKVLWLLGEMGLVYPLSVPDAVPMIAEFLNCPDPLLRERAANALGRIGRANYSLIEPYWQPCSVLPWMKTQKSVWRLSGRRKTSQRTCPTFMRSMLQNNIEMALKMRLIESGLTQTEIAEKAGGSLSYVNRITKGREQVVN